MPEKVQLHGLPGDMYLSRATEAVIWGMPAVSMAAFRNSMQRDIGADFGDIIYFSNVMAPRHEFLTANHETP
jgi:hypothetical protein